MTKEPLGEEWLDVALLAASTLNEGAREQVQLALGSQPGYSAILSTDELYRFVLMRPIMGAEGKVLVSCGLNPSKADAFIDDSTVRKECGFARRWGCYRYIKINAYAWRDTHPNDLWAARRSGRDIVGALNDEIIRCSLRSVVTYGGCALAAWGNDVDTHRAGKLLALAAEVGVQWMCLGRNKNGSPKHSLYPPYSTVLESWP